jgi:hypothetical protein
LPGTSRQVATDLPNSMQSSVERRHASKLFAGSYVWLLATDMRTRSRHTNDSDENNDGGAEFFRHATLPEFGAIQCVWYDLAFTAS